MNEIYVYQARLPKNIKEAVLPCVGGFTIYLNENLSEKQKKEAYDHALKHIELGHFDITCDKDVQQMELEAHYGKT